MVQADKLCAPRPAREVFWTLPLETVAVTNRRSHRDMRILVSILALTAGLTACATLPATPGSSLDTEAGAPGSDAVQVDPLDAPPPTPAAAAAARAADPLLLVPAPAEGEASQRVPLGTLNASADPKPAAKPPTPLNSRASVVPPATAKTPSPPVIAVSAPAPAPPPALAAVSAPVAPVAPVAPPPAPSEMTTAATPPAKTAPLTVQPGAGAHVSPRGVPQPGPEIHAAGAAPAAAPPTVTPPSPRVPILDEEEEETTVISSVTAPPAVQGREFIPAPVVPVAAPPAPPALGEMPFTQAEKNVARRFETMSRLRDEGLITQEEFNRRRATNLGAILPYSQDPPGVGLDRSVPSADAIIARLGALRRSFEMRAITAQQHALERTMILNALLPESPEQRTARKAPPEDVIQGAAMVGHLEALREEGVITQPELDAERRMIDAVLRTGLFPPKGMAADAAKPAQAKTAAKPAAPAAAAGGSENPMDTPITGPVLHLASFRSEASAKQGWQEVLERNKATLGAFKPIIRRVDLGEGRGIFYRLMTGSFGSMAEAEGICVKLKQNNQFCRTSADGS